MVGSHTVPRLAAAVQHGSLLGTDLVRRPPRPGRLLPCRVQEGARVPRLGRGSVG